MDNLPNKVSKSAPCRFCCLLASAQSALGPSRHCCPCSPLSSVPWAPSFYHEGHSHQRKRPRYFYPDSQSDKVYVKGEPKFRKSSESKPWHSQPQEEERDSASSQDAWPVERLQGLPGVTQGRASRAVSCGDADPLPGPPTTIWPGLQSTGLSIVSPPALGTLTKPMI